jgi:hypothetical protein
VNTVMNCGHFISAREVLKQVTHNQLLYRGLWHGFIYLYAVVSLFGRKVPSLAVRNEDTTGLIN